ncbi:hypothetical protein GA0116948_10159 [Chitinophaga costaii]|uniref:Uncharacterized protein n=1 Tax=Chitinophaga costaii TaxID=1335309 RepID=A0A1C3YRB3_9BACT|nr:hypothetical protein GA0116948_10159 [Chitinophaga costaii]
MELQNHFFNTIVQVISNPRQIAYRNVRNFVAILNQHLLQ